MRDLIHRPALLGLIVAAGLWAGSAGVGFAGNGNVLYLLQDSSPFGPGESFQSDQSHSSYSSIGSALQWVTQQGSGDSASVTINSACQAVSGSCGHADLMQAGYDGGAASGEANTLVLKAADALTGTDVYKDGSPNQQSLNSSEVSAIMTAAFANILPLSGSNQATLTVNGQGSASVSQYGSGNSATLTVGGADGTLNQVGLNNQATLEVTSGSFTFNQIGQGNKAYLTAAVGSGNASTYTQVGNGSAWGAAGTPFQVDSTSAGLSVAHYSY